MPKELSPSQIRNMVFKAHLKKVQGKKLNKKDRDILIAWILTSKIVKNKLIASSRKKKRKRRRRK